MANPRYSTQWPTAGERHVRAALEYATPTTDELGGVGEPVWTEFGKWWAKVATVMSGVNETDAAISYQVEGPYRSDLVEKFRSGVGVRVVTADYTLKVFKIVDSQLRKRSLIAHCADAVNTQ